MRTCSIGIKFRLARGRFEELRTHDADADTGTDRAEADDEADRDRGVALNLGD
jgi:hypothetical protein